MRTCEHIVAIRMVKLCHKIVLKKLILHSHIIRCSCLSSSRTTNLEEAQMLQPTFSCPLIVFFYVTKSDLHAVSILSYRYYSLSDDGAKINIASRYISTIFYTQSTTKAVVAPQGTTNRSHCCYKYLSVHSLIQYRLTVICQNHHRYNHIFLCQY